MIDEGTEEAPPGVDATVSHAARVYDYLLGGTANFEIDRQLARRQAQAYGGLENAQATVRANRSFLGRAVRYLVNEAGLRQFLDLGTGLPSVDHVHQVAQREAPDCRIVYVDNDPLVLTHAQTLLQSTSEGATTYVNGDVTDVENILLRAGPVLDLDAPFAVVLSAILHLVPDEADPYGIVARLVAAMPSGSHLLISHMASDIDIHRMSDLAEETERLQPQMGYSFALRSRDEVTRFTEGLELVPPGVVRVDEWRPGPVPDRPTPVYALLARKP
jgi:hypothetical protein